ncbi:MAG: PASTA domain-containing protein [Rubricoccaceae bacterium]|nr:PASTA domain-containing protein [Rubricoccaceae bacterium]
MAPVVRSKQFWLMLGGAAGAFCLFLLLLNFAVMPLWTRHDAAVSVPEIREMQAEEAVSVLRDAGLRAELREQPFNPNITADMVVDQNPLPNTMVKPGRRVYYYVNASPREMVNVPDVRTRSEGVARDDIRAAGLIVGDILLDTLHNPFEGTVTRQTPQGGHMVPRGSRVILWLSPGIGLNQVRLPNIEGLRPEDARREILAAGLWVAESAVRGDTIRWTEPRHGTLLREGTEVKMHTSEPPEDYNPPPSPPREPTEDSTGGMPLPGDSGGVIMQEFPFPIVDDPQVDPPGETPPDNGNRPAPPAPPRPPVDRDDG